MTKVISFISRKGGTGKTTNAINLASTLFTQGKKVLLIETDTNYTINSLRQLELFKSKEDIANYFHLVASEDQVVAKEIKKLVKNGDYDYVIIDSAGKTTDKGIKELCLVTDLILVTTSLNQNDLIVTYQTVEDLKPAQDLNKKLKILIVPNRINTLTSKKTIKNALKELNVDVMEEFVPNRRSFYKASTLKLEKRYKQVAKEIITYLNK